MPNFIEIGLVVWISIADTHGTHIDFYILDTTYKPFMLSVIILSVVAPPLKMKIQKTCCSVHYLSFSPPPSGSSRCLRSRPCSQWPWGVQGQA
jgi:hypothetical protein